MKRSAPIFPRRTNRSWRWATRSTALPHVTHVAAMAGYLLETLGYDAHTVELAKIAGYLHDIGNLVNRIEHSQSGAVMAFQILTSLGFGAEDVATIVTAIGNHDEGTGVPVNAVAALSSLRTRPMCAAAACAIRTRRHSTSTTA